MDRVAKELELKEGESLRKRWNLRRGARESNRIRVRADSGR